MAFLTNPLNFPNLTVKASPVAADLLLIADSANSNLLSQCTVGSLPFGGAGNMVQIAQVVASASAAVNFTADLSATYKNYLITYKDLYNTTASTFLYMQIGYGGTPTYVTTGYTTYTLGFSSAVSSVGATTYMVIAGAQFYMTSSIAGGIQGQTYLFNTQAGGGAVSQYSVMTGVGYAGQPGALSAGTSANTNAMTSLQYTANTATSLYGTFTLYGLTY